MAKTTATRPKNKKKVSKSFKSNKFGFSRKNLLITMLAFAVVGGFLLYRTFAATLSYEVLLSPTQLSQSYSVTTGRGPVEAVVTNAGQNFTLTISKSDGTVLQQAKTKTRLAKKITASLNVEPGTYKFTVSAKSLPGKRKLGLTINYPDADTGAPAVKITSPTAAELKGTVKFSADATDTQGMSRVDFYANDKMVGTDTSSPYSVDFNTLTLNDGGVTLVAKAYDTSGNVGTASVMSSIKNVVAPPPSTSAIPSDPVAAQAWYQANTGASAPNCGPLTPYTGPTTITSPTTITNKEITTSLTIRAAVTLTCVSIAASPNNSGTILSDRAGGSITADYVTVNAAPAGSTTAIAAMYLWGSTGPHSIKHSQILNGTQAIFSTANNLTLDTNYIYVAAPINTTVLGGNQHVDGVQLDGGTSLNIKNNWIQLASSINGGDLNATLWLNNNQGSMSASVDNNFLNCGGNYELHMRRYSDSNALSLSITNNKFVRKPPTSIGCNAKGGPLGPFNSGPIGSASSSPVYTSWSNNYWADSPSTQLSKP